MTQEQIIRRMLAGFAADPPDSEHQEGFLSAIIMVAQEVMSFAWNDPDILKAEKACDRTLPSAQPTLQKAARTFKIISGGKPDDPPHDGRKPG